MRLLFVFIGIILTLILYSMYATAAISIHHSSQNIPSGLWLPVTLLIFFLSSLLTGLLVAPYINNNFREYLLSSPRLYLFVLGTFIAIANIISNELPATLTMGRLLAWLALGTIYTLTSCTAVALGCKLRAKGIRHNPKT